MEKTFDYVIVGAGSSGCVMANRLSENGKNSVLILEAGGKDRNLFIHMPSGYSQIVPTKSNLNYGFETEPEPTSCREAGARKSKPEPRSWRPTSGEH